MEVVARKNVLIRCILMIVSATCVVCRVLVSVLHFKANFGRLYSVKWSQHFRVRNIRCKRFQNITQCRKAHTCSCVAISGSCLSWKITSTTLDSGHHVCIYDDSRKCLMFIINFIVSHVTKLVCTNMVFYFLISS